MAMLLNPLCDRNKMKRFLDYFSLFGSTGTLFCCAIPALLVAIGAGGVMATLYANVPGYTWLVKYKDALFASVLVVLLINGFLLWQRLDAPCPIDKSAAQACIRTRKYSIVLYFISITLFLIGFFFAYIASYLL